MNNFRPPWPSLLAATLMLSVPAALGLEWDAQPGYRSFPLPVLGAGKPGFTLLPPESTGLTFTNQLSEYRHVTNHILLNGAGAAAGDVDGDGWCDLYFCRSEGSNALYRNLGNWKFEDITASAGVACSNLTSTGAAFADLDGDGDLDLIVNTMGNGTRVFFNDGHGRFSEAPFVLNGNSAGMSLAMADVDGDGWVDLFIANHRTSSLMDVPNARVTFKKVDGKLQLDTLNGRSLTEPDLAHHLVYDALDGVKELGEVPVLYRNRSGTNFEAVSWTGGAFLDEEGTPLTEPPRDWGLTAAFHDVNGDGLPDLYVCNDFWTEDRLWINQGGGIFKLIPWLAQRKTSMSSMSVDFGDINRDGYVDFLVLDMMSRSHSERMRFSGARPPVVHLPGLINNRPQYELNTLFLNRGDQTFAEIAQLSGLQASEWAWSCLFLDVDLDGWEDVLVVNGMERAARDLDVADYIKKLRASRKLSDAEVFEARRRFPRQATAKLAFRNRRDLTFEEVGRAWGFDTKGVSSSMALADLDNDGDLDVIVNNLNDAAGIFRNDTSAPRIAVRLRGLPPNTHGIGARITVTTDGLPPQTQEIIAGGRYLSGDDPVRAFAASTATNRLTIEVRWRANRRSLLEAVPANRLYEVDEAGAKEAPNQPNATPSPVWFEDVSARLNHQHHEEPFNDWAEQPLLPNKLSQLGPGVAWFDVDGNGWDDLIVGSGKGGRLAVLRNDHAGGFQAMTNAALGQITGRDQTTVVGWYPEPGRRTLLAGTANYEDGLAQGAAVQQYDLTAGTVTEAVSGTETSVGPLCIADVDGDGALDVFVGGRVVPAKYPVAAQSRVFHNEHGRLVLDAARTAAVAGAGMVSGAVFADLEGNGHPSLVVACEWGPVRVYREESGRWVEATKTLGLENYRGWWTGVTVGDFDEDGRLDIVAGNWGRNTKYEPFRMKPLRLYYGEIQGPGTMDLVESHYDADLRKYVPERQLNPLAQAMPFLRERFASNLAYSTAGIEEVLGDRLGAAKVLEANWLETTLFLNRGDHFEAHALPIEAQFSPAFGLCVADADGDGHEDIFLAQNFFAAQSETPRCDAGRGLWLQGDGKGGFAAVAGQQSGVTVYGDQRGAAVCDYDGDGRVDLAVAQNGAPTRLFHNLGARPGLRVRLRGPAGNPDAIGAVVRLRFGEHWGPARQVHAGAGYWSSDSVVQVLGMPSAPTQIQVRWPGGKLATSDVPAGARGVIVSADGRLEVEPPR